MNRRAETIAKVAIPVRALVHRFALLFLILAAFAIMLLGKADTFVIEKARTSVIDVVAPVMDALSKPMSTVTEGVDRVVHFFDVYEENARLREQNERLLEWQNAALALSAENSMFRKMLNYVPEHGARFAAARVVGDSGGVFVRSVLINAGTADGIEKGDAVVNGDGLVGRVAEAGRKAARVLLVTDLNSRIPVVAEKSRVRAILAGDNSAQPRLAFLPPNAQLEPGDRIVTSGHGGVFPAGLAVGRIASISDGTIRVRTFFQGKSFAVIWFCFSMVAISATLLAWVIVCALDTALINPTPALFQAVLTIGAFPFMAWLLARCQHAILRPVDVGV